MLTLAQLLFSQGFGTRKMCALLIADGVVSVNGRVGDNADEKIAVSEPDFSFSVHGVAWPYREKAYVMLNKPIG